MYNNIEFLKRSGNIEFLAVISNADQHQYVEEEADDVGVDGEGGEGSNDEEAGTEEQTPPVEPMEDVECRDGADDLGDGGDPGRVPCFQRRP